MLAKIPESWNRATAASDAFSPRRFVSLVHLEARRFPIFLMRRIVIVFHSGICQIEIKVGRTDYLL